MHASPGGAPPEGPIRRIDWTGPFVLAAICFFSFGLLLSRLGYFQDDWHHVFYAATQGTQGLRSFLLTDRGPFAWLVYAPLFKILGYSPSGWHWAMMLVRLLTVLVFWLSVRRIWPRRESLTIWLGLLFAIYPIFTLQPLAVAYALHWTMYLVFMISILLMLEAAQNSGRFLLLTGLALILEAAHLLMIEYFSGLELARPILLWLLLSDLAPRERRRRSLRLALPYLGVLLLYAVYRASFGLIFGFDRFNTLATLGALAQSPLTTLPGILQAIVQDVIHVLFSQWYAAMDPAIIDFSRPSTFLILGSGAVWAAATFLLLRRSDRRRKAPDMESHPGQVAIAGASLLILSMLPFWLTGFSIYQKNQLWSERLALGAMPGASMLIVGAVFALMDRPASRNLVLSILIGLGVAMHARTARDFQASWDKQLQLYWQLHWRAPSLRPNTLLVSDQEILFFMGIYPTAFSINVLYPQVTQPPEASYWFNAGFEHMDYDAFAGGAPKTFEKYGTTFSATAEHVLAITFEPGQDQCLWVLRPGLANATDAHLPGPRLVGGIGRGTH